MNISSKEEAHPKKDRQAKERELRVFEAFAWLMIALTLLVANAYPRVLAGESATKVFLSFEPAQAWVGIIALFPVLVQMIYGKLPVEALRYAHNEGMKDEENAKSQWAEHSPAELFALYSKQSSEVANRIFSRAGLYLLVGSVIAIGAASGFFLQSSTITSKNTFDISAIFVELAPRATFLFFLELVAFYFLRQSRIAMEEYRYFEEIQRRREEILAIIRITALHGTNVDLVELVKNGTFSSNVKNLQAGETTEILENKKLDRGELELLQKVIEAISLAKK
jgi:hypothetical protein